MHQVAKQKGTPVCDYYTHGGAQGLRLVRPNIFYFNSSKPFNGLKIGHRFFTFGPQLELRFFKYFENVHFPHSISVFEKTIIYVINILTRTCDFENFKNHMKS